MKKTVCLAVIALLSLSPVILAGDTASGEASEGVLFYEVQPYGNYEGLSIFNYGAAAVNLNGWSVTDREGTLSFTKNTYIAAGSRLTITKGIDENDRFSGRDGTITFTDSCFTRSGTFTLADSGDDLYLYKGGALMDAVGYGSKKADAGWIGDPVKMPSGKYLLRMSSNDTDTFSDWASTKPGISNNFFDPDLFFDAKVSPFSFPESSGTPVFREIEKAEEEVLISIYLLTSEQMAALLCGLLDKGVDVRILLEGNMLGDNSFKTELSLMMRIVEAGGEVYLINDRLSGNPERYSYVHNKYAVIDEKAVVLTSENWTPGNMSSKGNRGWGAVVESKGYAEYVKDIFLNDVSTEWGDVYSLSDFIGRDASYSDVVSFPGTLTYSGLPSSYAATSYDAKVMPSFSPDNSNSTLRYFIENADTRVYSQQMDLGSSYSNLIDASPLKWLADAAERGLDVRFMLDASINKSEVLAEVDAINSTTGINALAVSGRPPLFSLIHNKGVIIDDMVWLASVNWTENSFMNNRESAVIIDSPEVAKFFTDLFKQDWGISDWGSDPEPLPDPDPDPQPGEEDDEGGGSAGGNETLLGGLIAALIAALGGIGYAFSKRKGGS